MDTEKDVFLIPIDDNIVEYDEKYTIAINITGHGRIKPGKNSTANVTIKDDDGK